MTCNIPLAPRYIRVVPQMSQFILRSEIFNWVKENLDISTVQIKIKNKVKNNYEYPIFTLSNYWEGEWVYLNMDPWQGNELIFQNENDAMLFKLHWWD